MKEKGFAPIIILLGVLLIVGIAVVVYNSEGLEIITTKFTNTPTPQVTNNSNQSLVPTTIPTPMPVWRTYIDSKYSYLIKYPDNLCTSFVPCDGEGPTPLALDVNPIKQDYSKSEYPECYFVKQSVYYVGDFKAVKYHSVENQDYPEDCHSMEKIHATNRSTHLVFNNDSNTYVVTLPGYKNGYDQEKDLLIDETLSSFKILNKNGLSSAIESVWKTYTDNEGGFSLKYPSEWEAALCPKGQTFPDATLNFWQYNWFDPCGGSDSLVMPRISFKDKMIAEEEMKLYHNKYKLEYSDIYLGEEKVKAKKYYLIKDLQSDYPDYSSASVVIYIPHKPKRISEKYDYMVITYPAYQWVSDHIIQNIDRVLESLKLL